MRFTYAILIALGSFVFVACGGDAPVSSDTTSSDTTATTPTTENYENSNPAPATHDCNIQNDLLEGNQLWIRDEQTLVAIVADSTTYDEDFGPSHRVLEVYNTENCELVKREVLPVNVSPDFPYYITQISYDNATGLVAIRGFKDIILYDVENQSTLSPIVPQFRFERLLDDPQSGMIQRLEVWENYLIGYAQDMGTFAFDLSDRSNPKAILAEAEYETEEDGFASLFILSVDSNSSQILIPEYDYEDDAFEINAMLSNPTAISDQITNSARNNRYIVLRERNEARTPHVFDLQEHREISLPANVAGQSTQDILKYAKQQ